MPIPSKDELTTEMKDKIDLAYKSAVDKLEKRKEENIMKLKEKLDTAASNFKSKLSE
ncbi:MAG: hypothetical protein F7B60_03880 [Desulfurococcales archaeon]|nr:hypothetical protein [Desulfurococcales archaeon]